MAGPQQPHVETSGVGPPSMQRPLPIASAKGRGLAFHFTVGRVLPSLPIWSPIGQLNFSVTLVIDLAQAEKISDIEVASRSPPYPGLPGQA